MLLADYRMPQMNGIQFLEAAMDLFPAGPPGAAHRVRRHRRRDRRDQPGRRRPLPAQAVAPAGGEALPGARRAARGVGRRRPTRRPTEIRVIGHRWSAPSFKVRDFLARNLVPYRWFLADDPEGGRLLDRGGRHRDRRAAGHHHRGQVAGQPTRGGAGRQRRADHDPGVGLLRPGRGRRRARPGSARPSTAPPRGCAPCWSRSGPPVARPARAAGSRTTWAFPTACPARS